MSSKFSARDFILLLLDSDNKQEINGTLFSKRNVFSSQRNLSKFGYGIEI